jgi:mannose-6-phosphate isomerase-like protein (cupin superfamily)
MQHKSVFIVNRCDVSAFITKDGSTIRELIAPNNVPEMIRRQSLAEATLRPGAETEAHFHPVTEEIYYILSGAGRIQIETEICFVGSGDSIAIPPGAAHTIQNIGETDLIFLCCCAPAYTHDDTVMVAMPPPGVAVNESHHL